MRRAAICLLLSLATLLVAAAPARAENPLPEKDQPGWVATLTDFWEATPSGFLTKLGLNVADAIDGECFPTGAPDIQAPESGHAAWFMTGPVPGEGLYATSGVGGFENAVWEPVCSVDPRDYPPVVNATLDTNTANGLTSFALGTTAAADTIDRQSWDPSWIVTFLRDLASGLTEGIRVHVFLPWMAVGVLFAAVLLLVRARSGDAATTYWGAAWAVIVIGIALLVLVSPLRPAQLLQEGSAGVVAQLNGGTDPATAQTELTVQAVHYPAWERRMFGETDTTTTRTHGQAMFEATRWSWAELEAIEDEPAVRKELAEAKAVQFVSHALTIKHADPDAYRHVQGIGGSRTDDSTLELGYTLAANGFRIFAAALRIMCIIALFVTGIVWLAAAFFLVSEKGENLGRALLNNSGRAIKYAVVASLGSWGFMQYTQVAMSPTMAPGWSLFLLVLGVILFWGLIRPDRKILSLLTMGHVRGYGKSAQWAANKAVNYVSTKIAVKEAHDERGTPATAPAASPPPSAPPVMGSVQEPRPYQPYSHPVAMVTSNAPNVVAGEVIYTRDETPRPQAPPPGARADVGDVYTRPSAREDVGA